MKTDHFNLESITELGDFHFTYVGNAIGGGEWWGIYVGERCVFHIRTTSQAEVEDIFSRQKNYPYYCPTEKDHFFFFEDRLYHVNPAMVDPLAEMIILYFSKMTKKLKPAIKNIQREFGESLVKFDKILKQKAEKAVIPPARGTTAYATREGQPLAPAFTEPQSQPSFTSQAQTSYRPQAASVQPSSTQSPQPQTPSQPSFTSQPQAPQPQTPSQPSFTSQPQAPQPQTPSQPSFTSQPQASQPQTPTQPTFTRPADPVKSSSPDAEPPAAPTEPSFTKPVGTGYGTPATPATTPAGGGAPPAASSDQGGDRNKELQRERMRERRRRLGLPEDVPT
jgi:hypothetical protein